LSLLVWVSTLTLTPPSLVLCCSSPSPPFILQACSAEHHRTLSYETNSNKWKYLIPSRFDKGMGNFHLSKAHLFLGGLSLSKIHGRTRIPRKSGTFALQSTSMPKNIPLNMQNCKGKSVFCLFAGKK
jgi:hypothetical protein